MHPYNQHNANPSSGGAWGQSPPVYGAPPPLPPRPQQSAGAAPPHDQHGQQQYGHQQQHGQRPQQPYGQQPQQPFGHQLQQPPPPPHTQQSPPPGQPQYGGYNQPPPPQQHSYPQPNQAPHPMQGYPQQPHGYVSPGQQPGPQPHQQYPQQDYQSQQNQQANYPPPLPPRHPEQQQVSPQRGRQPPPLPARQPHPGGFPPQAYPSHPQSPPQPHAQAYQQHSQAQPQAHPRAAYPPPPGPQHHQYPQSPPQATRQPPRLGESVVVPLPVIRANGPLAAPASCAGGRVMEYKMGWHTLATSTGDRLMCPWCYETYAVPLGLEREFGHAELEGGTCEFTSFRAKAFLLAREMDGLRSYFERRGNFKPCPGAEGVAAADGFTWFVADGDMMACEACYADTVCAAPATLGHWVQTPQIANQVWSCDLSLPILDWMYVKLGWDEWLSLARRRLAAPECTGDEMRADSRLWYTTRRPLEGFIICETCYLDHVVGSRFADEFVTKDMPADRSEQWACDMPVKSISVPWLVANGHAGFDVFHSAVSKVFAGAIRMHQGDAPQFYSIDPNVDFDICERCRDGILAPLGMAKFLQRRPPGPRACDMCPGTARGHRYLAKLLGVVDTGVWATFYTFVCRLANIPACPGRNVLESAEWYGWSRLKICPECWESFAEDTSLASQVEARGEHSDAHSICSLYSPRMRALWSEACASGDLEGLLEFSERRSQVYVNTIMEADRLQTMMTIEAGNAAMQGVQSVQYQGMHNMALLMGNTGGTEYGNSSLGWFATSQGATAAQLGLSSQQGWANVNSTNRHMEIALLRAKWTEVE